MHLFQKAMEIAVKAHGEQVDKCGYPYIYHPVAVARRLAFEGKAVEFQIVAILHDVVEDSDITLEDLARQGFPAAIISAVDAMTKRPGELYEAYLLRVADNRVACEVKLRDLGDNLRPERSPCLTEEKIKKYERARVFVSARLAAAWE